METFFAHSSVIALGAMGLSLVLLAGGIDLSAGALAVLSGAVAALCIQHGHAPWTALGAALLAAGGIGALNGILVSTLRAASWMITLGMFGVIHGVARWLAGATRVLPPDAFWGLRGKSLAPLAVLALLLAVIAVALLHWSVPGRHLRAIGSNEAAAALCGVRIRGIKTLTYAVAGLLFGAAGLGAMMLEGAADTRQALGLQIAFLAAALLGGIKWAGAPLGAFGGALIFGMLHLAVQKTGWPAPLQEAGIGALLVVAVGIRRLRET